MFFKKKQLNSEEFDRLSKRISMIEIDISLLTDRVEKAIRRKVIKKQEETETDNSKNPVLLPE